LPEEAEFGGEAYFTSGFWIGWDEELYDFGVKAESFSDHAFTNPASVETPTLEEREVENRLNGVPIEVEDRERPS
jgi:hypothetical protein